MIDAILTNTRAAADQPRVPARGTMARHADSDGVHLAVAATGDFALRASRKLAQLRRHAMARG